MKRPCLAIAVAMSACVLSTPIQAAALEASSSVNLSGLSFRLLDLDPTDGIDPSMQLISGDLSWEVVADLQSTSTLPLFGEVQAAQSQPIDAQNLLMPVQSALNTPTGQSLAEITVSTISASASTKMDAATARTGASQSASSYTDLIYSRFIEYSLSANTALFIGGRYALNADVLADETVGYGFAQANFLLSARRLSPDGDWVDYIIEDAVSVWALAGTESKFDSINMFLANESTTSQRQQLRLSTWAAASAQGLVSDVPEPTSLALLLAGLGVTAVRTRRCR